MSPHPGFLLCSVTQTLATAIVAVERAPVVLNRGFCQIQQVGNQATGSSVWQSLTMSSAMGLALRCIIGTLC